MGGMEEGSLFRPPKLQDELLSGALTPQSAALFLKAAKARIPCGDSTQIRSELLQAIDNAILSIVSRHGRTAALGQKLTVVNDRYLAANLVSAKTGCVAGH